MKAIFKAGTDFLPTANKTFKKVKCMDTTIKMANNKVCILTSFNNFPIKLLKLHKVKYSAEAEKTKNSISNCRIRTYKQMPLN